MYQIISAFSAQVPIFGAHLYDAVHIYAQAVSRVLAAAGDVRNGTAIMQYIRNRTYRSVQGFDVRIDGNGDAEGNYSVFALQHEQMRPIGYFIAAADEKQQQYQFRYMNSMRPIRWQRADGRPPFAEPRCGFDGEKCADDGRLPMRVWLVAGLIVVTIVGVGVAFTWRHWRYEQKLAGLLWRVERKDVRMLYEPSARSMDEDETDCEKRKRVVRKKEIILLNCYLQNAFRFRFKRIHKIFCPSPIHPFEHTRALVKKSFVLLAKPIIDIQKFVRSLSWKYRCCQENTETCNGLNA